MMWTMRLEGVLNSATHGSELAVRVIARLQQSERVSIDASAVTRVTPSFANAFTMRVLAAVPDALVAERLVVDSPEFVVAAVWRAHDRYSRGVLLSDQRLLAVAS